MPITFECVCGKTIRAKDENAGRRVKCSSCGEIFVVPGLRIESEPAIKAHEENHASVSTNPITVGFSPRIKLVSSYLGGVLTVLAIWMAWDVSNRPKKITPKIDARIATLKSYFACQKWEDRLAFVRRPEDAKAEMAKSYAVFLPTNEYSIDPTPVPCKSSIYPEAIAYVYTVNFPEQGPRHAYKGDYFLVKTKKGWKIDWEASHLENPLSLLEYCSNPQSEPAAFRVNCGLGSSFFDQYSDSQPTHYNIDITDYSGKVVRGYVRKDSLAGASLFGILKSGRLPSVIIVARHTVESDTPTYTRDFNRSMLEITGLVCDVLISPPFDD